MDENSTTQFSKDTQANSISLSKSGIFFNERFLVKHDKDGKVIAELNINDIQRIGLKKKIDYSFIIWLAVGGGLGWIAHSYINSTIVSVICYVIASLIGLIGITTITSLKLAIERNGENLHLTVEENYEEALAFIESFKEKRATHKTF